MFALSRETELEMKESIISLISSYLQHNSIK